jgi:hypothetical protein
VLRYTSRTRFILVTPMVLELRALGFFYYMSYACNTIQSPKAGPLVMASITRASSSQFMSPYTSVNVAVLYSQFMSPYTSVNIAVFYSQFMSPYTSVNITVLNSQFMFPYTSVNTAVLYL